MENKKICRGHKFTSSSGRPNFSHLAGDNFDAPGLKSSE
jgi:hypothetical protein